MVGAGNSEDACIGKAAGNPTDELDFGNFSAACSSNDKVQIMDVLKLFDRDRKTLVLERLFMPRYVRTMVIDATGPREQGTGSPSQSQGTQAVAADPTARGSSFLRPPSASQIEISVEDSLGESVPKASDSQRMTKALSKSVTTSFSTGSVGHKAYERVLALEKQVELLTKSAADSASAFADLQKAIETHVQAVLSKALRGELVLTEKASSDCDEALEAPEAPGAPGTRTLTSVFITRNEVLEAQQQNLQALADLQRELKEYVDQSDQYMQQCMEKLAETLRDEAAGSARRLLEASGAARVDFPKFTADPAATHALDAKHPDACDPLEPRLRGITLPVLETRHNPMPVTFPAPASAGEGGARPSYFKKEVVFTKHCEGSKFASRRGALAGSS